MNAGGTQELAFYKGLLAAHLIASKQIGFGRTHLRLTLLLRQTQDRHTIDAEHQCLQRGIDLRDITRSLNDLHLKCWCVRHFEHGIDVVQIDLPEPEHLHLGRMHRGQVKRSLQEPEEGRIGFAVVPIPGFAQIQRWRLLLMFGSRIGTISTIPGAIIVGVRFLELESTTWSAGTYQTVIDSPIDQPQNESLYMWVRFEARSPNSIQRQNLLISRVFIVNGSGCSAWIC